MRARYPFLLLILTSVLGASTAFGASTHSRDLRRRTVTVDDASVDKNTLPELHVAGGFATVLNFNVKVTAGNAIPGVAGNEADALFHQLAHMNDNTVMLVPKKDLSRPVPVSFTLADGTVVTFKCISSPRDVDAQIDVIVALKRRAPESSAPALKQIVGQLRSQLDECQATSAEAGARKLAELLLSQSLDSPQAFERHPLRYTTKDNRLLVEARWAYRLLGLSYIVVSVENRDPDKIWVLDRAEVKVTGGGQSSDIVVRSVATELPSLAPNVGERIVVAFTTPTTADSQKITLTLMEKDGARNVSLSGLEL